MFALLRPVISRRNSDLWCIYIFEAMYSQIPNSVIEMFYDCNIYNIKTQEGNPCIVIFFTDLCTFRLVETVTELQY